MESCIISPCVNGLFYLVKGKRPQGSLLWLHVAGLISFLKLNSKYCMDTPHHLPDSVHLSCCRILVVVNSTVMNMRVLISLPDTYLNSSHECSEVGLLDPMVVLFLIF